MLISAEVYYDVYLKGKDAETVRREADVLRSEISRLKALVESPEYYYMAHSYPSETEQIRVYREYLTLAKKALAALGAPSETEAEMAARLTEEKNEYISRIILTTGTEGGSRYELLLDGEAASLRVSAGEQLRDVPLLKDDVMRAVSELHIGEWRSEYLPEDYGCSLDESSPWSLSVEYSDGTQPRIHKGNGVYPYSFDSLKTLLV